MQANIIIVPLTALIVAAAIAWDYRGAIRLKPVNPTTAFEVVLCVTVATVCLVAIGIATLLCFLG